MDVYRYVPPQLIEIKIAAPACSVQVPTLAPTRLHVFGKASTMSTPLCAVLGWFLGFRDRRNTPVFVVSSRTESASLLDTPSETPDLDLNLLWRCEASH